MSVQDGCQSVYSLTIKVYRTRLCFPSAGLFTGLRAFGRPSVDALCIEHHGTISPPTSCGFQAIRTMNTIVRIGPSTSQGSSRQTPGRLTGLRGRASIFYCLSDLRSSVYTKKRLWFATICPTYGVQVFRFVSCSCAMEDMSVCVLLF